MVRRRLLAFGVCAVLAGGVVAFLTIVSLDWLLDLPPLLRLFATAAFLTGFLLSLIQWVVRPLGTPLGLEVIAAQIEEHFKTLEDRLSSTVDFVQHGSSGSERLTREVVTRTESLLNQLPLESALSLRPVLVRAVAFCLCVAALGGIAMENRRWMQIGVYRYLYPFGEIEWPRSVSLLPLTGHQAVAVGESVTVRMAATRGLHDELRGLVRLREPDGKTATLAMQREPDGTFAATIDAVTQELTYWFEAGDDSTQRSPFTIRVVKRPEIVEAWCVVKPPPYAGRRRSETHDLSEGAVPAPIGGEVDITVRASKPIPADPTGDAVGLRSQDGRFFPLANDPRDATRLTTTYAVEDDLYFRIELRDAEGFENRGAAEFSILAVPDAPPRVTVLEPPAVVELTPQGATPLAVRVDDDFGVTSLVLEVEHIGGEPPAPLSLTGSLEPLEAERGAAMLARHEWRIAMYHPAPGDVLLYRAAAADNRVGAAGVGQRGASSPLRIRVISDAEFDARVRAELGQLEARLRQALLEQMDIRDRTGGVIRSDAGAGALTRAERELVAGLSSTEARLSRRVKETATRMDRLAERMKQNVMKDEEGQRKVEHLANQIARTAGGAMTEAGVSLGEARDHVDSSAQQDSLRTAASREEEAVAELRAALNTLSEWGSFQEMLTRSREWLDRQNTARTQTLQLGESMLGKSVDSLSASEQAALKKAAREQEQLAADVKRLLERMQRLLDTSREKDPAGAEALDDALRAARAHQVEKYVQEAVPEIEENRTAAAGISQKNAADAMGRVVNALRARETRELEELRKRLREAEDLLAQYLEDQKTLRAAAHEAGLLKADETAFADLSDEQRRLTINVGLFADELAQIEKALGAARIIEEASQPMGEAAAYLRDRQASPATASQDRAIALLEEALVRLEESARDTEGELLRRSLGQIREDLEEIAAAQRAVNQGVEALKVGVEKAGRITRNEARAASNLARGQSDVRGKLEEQLPDFDKVPVYRWALDRVLTWMTQCREKLDRRDIDQNLVATGQRIVGELEKLIAAIKETEAMPLDTAFMEAERGEAGGPGQQAAGKQIPTVAELLVLKAMQVDISERTRQFDETIDPDTATEDQLRELRALGEDQGEVRRLTEMVVQKAKGP